MVSCESLAMKLGANPGGPFRRYPLGTERCVLTGVVGGFEVRPANAALNLIDEIWASKGKRLGELIRYCGDFVVLCSTKDRAEEVRSLIAATLARVDGNAKALLLGTSSRRDSRTRFLAQLPRGWRRNPSISGSVVESSISPEATWGGHPPLCRLVLTLRRMALTPGFQVDGVLHVHPYAVRHVCLYADRR